MYNYEFHLKPAGQYESWQQLNELVSPVHETVILLGRPLVRILPAVHALSVIRKQMWNEEKSIQKC